MEILTVPYILSLVALFFLYTIGLYIHRIFFDSLSKFPGPKLAAASQWYEFYYDVVLKGKYTFEIARMHQKYGPIIRINPDEIHINDPFYLDDLYPGAAVRRTKKYKWAMRMFGHEDAFFATAGHEIHRIRRAAFANFFSKSSLQKLEPGIQAMIDKLVVRLEGLKGTERKINLVDAFSSLTGDIIGQYAFAAPPGFLDDPDFSPHWHQLFKEVAINSHLLKHFYWLGPIMSMMPKWLVRLTNPRMLTLMEFQTRWRQQIVDIKAAIAEGSKPRGQTTIFYDVLTNPQVRPEEKETDYLGEEAQFIVAAGTTTTTHILSTIAFHVINDRSIRERLSAELAPLTSKNPQPTWQQLEQLPYLIAVITEGLRVGQGVSHRLQRLSPDVALHYEDYEIPKDTPTSMTSTLIHSSPTLFPSPSAFSPDRFLADPSLRKYIFSFSKGTRSCAGLNLAYCELYLALAALFQPGRFEWELYETGVEDVELAHDYFISLPRLESKGVRVVVN